MKFRLFKMSLTTKLKRIRRKPPDGWDLIEPTLEEFEAKMREVEMEPHEGKRRTETVWPIFRVSLNIEILIYLEKYQLLNVFF